MAEPTRLKVSLVESRSARPVDARVDGIEPPLRPRSLVLADDEDDLRGVLASLLREDGWEVVEAADGRAALEVIARVRPDVVLLDHRMPHLTGTEVHARLRAAGDRVPVVLVTAVVAVDKLADQAGIRYRLPKPIDLERLSGLLEQAFAESRGLP